MNKQQDDLRDEAIDFEQSDNPMSDESEVALIPCSPRSLRDQIVEREIARAAFARRSIE